ncbi:MAG: hypothetical protein LBT00_02730 [Spirochaetaceae bacterium]|nr:hypothetical protein [Spirochaetaceae bacterium]
MTGGDRHSESVAWPSLRTRRVKQSRRRRPSTGLLRFARNDGRNCRHCEEAAICRQRRSNPDGKGPSLGCFASLAMTGGTVVIARSKATKQSRRERPSTGLLRFARNDIGTVVIARSKATKQSRQRRPSTGLLRFARNDGRVVIARSSDEAIQTEKALHWIASLRSQ